MLLVLQRASWRIPALAELCCSQVLKFCKKAVKQQVQKVLNLKRVVVAQNLKTPSATVLGNTGVAEKAGKSAGLLCCSVCWQLLTQVRGHLHGATAVPRAQVTEVSNGDSDTLERGTGTLPGPVRGRGSPWRGQRLPPARPGTAAGPAPARPHLSRPGPPPGAGPAVPVVPAAGRGARRCPQLPGHPPHRTALSQPCRPAPRRASPRAAAWAGCRCPGEAA